MKRTIKCDWCGKALKHPEHPAYKIARSLLKARGREQLEHLPVLHDALADSDDPHHRALARYLIHASSGDGHYVPVEAVRDIRESLKRPGSVAGLWWKPGPERGRFSHHARSGFGRYNAHREFATNSYHLNYHLNYHPHGHPSYEGSTYLGLHDGIGATQRAAQEHHLRQYQSFHEEGTE